MKYWVFVPGIVLGVLFVWHIESRNVEAEIEVPKSVVPTIKPQQLVFHNNEEYEYLFTVVDPSEVALVPNFDNKKPGQSLVDENGCKMAINGGFYDKMDKPLGYFKSNNTVIRKAINSSLFDGFVKYVDKLEIDTAPPGGKEEYALQTGPRLVMNQLVRRLQIRNDKYARRMVAAVTKDGEFVWIAVFDPDSVFDGPKLVELPEVVNKIAKNEKLDIIDAINLDGGTASFYYSNDRQLNEFNPVGSIFCIKG